MTDLRAPAPLERPLADLLRAIGRSARLLARARPPEAGLRSMLQELGTAVTADRALFMPILSSGPAPEDHRFSVAQEWLRAGGGVASLGEALGDTPTPFIGDGYDFTRRLALLRVGQPFVYCDAKSLPANEAGLALRLGTQSSVRIPVLQRGLLEAMVGLDHTRTLWPWRPDALHALWLVGELAAGALAGFPRAMRPKPRPAEDVSACLAAWVRAGWVLLQAAGLQAALPTVLGEVERMFEGHRATFSDARQPGTLAVPVRGAADAVIGWLGLEAGEPEALDLLEPLAELMGARAELDAGGSRQALDKSA